MTTNTERDAFSRLPEELRIKIIKLSPDPLSLQNLAHASPAMGRVLDRYALEIVEVVLDVTVPVQTRRLMGAVLKARFSRFPASLSEAQKVAKTDSTVATNEMRSSGMDRAAAAVRSLLASTANVHTWSHACLEQLIRKSMELRPSTLIKNGTGRTCREEFENAESRKDYVPQETGPPSWVEEQRMIRSFWQLQFFLELQDAAHKGRLDTNWPRQEVNVLSQSSADVHENAYSLPTIRSVGGAVSRSPCAEPLSFECNKDTFSQGSENLDQTPWAYRFYSTMSSADGWLDGAPLTLVYPFQTWRKCGFVIWDEKRMVDLGMRHPKNSSHSKNMFFASFRWWSILTEDDLR